MGADEPYWLGGVPSSRRDCLPPVVEVNVVRPRLRRERLRLRVLHIDISSSAVRGVGGYRGRDVAEGVEPGVAEPASPEVTCPGRTDSASRSTSPSRRAHDRRETTPAEADAYAIQGVRTGFLTRAVKPS
jgi:hypothetical protein